MVKKTVLKKLYYTFILISILIIFLITLLTFNSHLRRDLYYKIEKSYYWYNHFRIKADLFNRDFESASQKILDYIEFSQKISEGKNKMLKGIYDITEMATSSTVNQNEINSLEKVYLEIDKITPDIYKNNVWLARSLIDNDVKKANEHLKRAIILSPSNEEAYRVIIKTFIKNRENKILFKKYCLDYFTKFEGSIKDNNNTNYFRGDNSQFSTYINDELSFSYITRIKDLNNYNNYNFNFENSKNINKINIVKNFFPGSKLSIRNILLYNNNKKKSIPLDKISSVSLSSYILDQSPNEIVFINTNNSDDTIEFYFDKIYKNIEKISFDLKLERLPLTSNLNCLSYYENKENAN